MKARLSRRAMAMAGGVSLLTFGKSAGAFARTAQESPAGQPDDISSLEQRLADTDPADIIATVGGSTVASPLFPSEVGSLRITPWEDDADVEGSQGAFQVTGSGEYLLVGAYVVYPGTRIAANVLEDRATGTDGTGLSSLLGLPSTSTLSMLGPITLVQVDRVLIWGFGMPPRSAIDATPGGVQDLTRFQLQSATFALALLDHLNEATR